MVYMAVSELLEKDQYNSILWRTGMVYISTLLVHSILWQLYLGSEGYECTKFLHGRIKE